MLVFLVWGFFFLDISFCSLNGLCLNISSVSHWWFHLQVPCTTMPTFLALCIFLAMSHLYAAAVSATEVFQPCVWLSSATELRPLKTLGLYHCKLSWFHNSQCYNDSRKKALSQCWKSPTSQDKKYCPFNFLYCCGQSESLGKMKWF